jgi:hypothetical protein
MMALRPRSADPRWHYSRRANLWQPLIPAFPLAIDGDAYFVADPTKQYGTEYGLATPTTSQRRLPGRSPVYGISLGPVPDDYRQIGLITLVLLVATVRRANAPAYRRHMLR